MAPRLPRVRLWWALPLLAALYVLTVLGASRWLGTFRVDLTQDHLYTLSPGTRDIVARLRQPLQLTLYFSDRASRNLPQLRAYHQRVVGMLEEVARQSGGRVQLAQVDPLPFSAAEDRATAAGLTPGRGEGNGDAVFFGLVAQNLANRSTAVIPFFLLAKEPFLEYDVAKLLYQVSTPHKPRVAIFSGLPIWGGTDADGNPAPEWAVLHQAQQLFDVKRLDATALAALGMDTDVLVLIHPNGLSTADVAEVDRYVRRGGRLLVFVDPDSEVDGGASSDLPKLFRTWGVEFDPNRVLLDRSRALVVQSPVTNAAVRDPAVLGLTRSEFNQRAPITAALGIVDLSSTGFFGLLPNATTRLEPLIQSTTEAMAVPTNRVRNALDPTTLYQDYAPDGKYYAVAVALRDTPRDAGTAVAARPTPDGRPRVILVGDTDVLSDRLWVQPGVSPNQALVAAFANNGDFFVNAIDELAGPSDLIAIRGRAVAERKFTRVDALHRQADEKFKAKQLQLQTELKETEQRIAALKQAGQGHSASAAQKAAVEQFVQRQLAIRTELRAVQRSLDADIERLSTLLKFIDILLMPMVLALTGLLYGAWRLRRRRAGEDWQ